MRTFNPTRIIEVLKNAGWYRWQLKSRRLHHRVTAFGWHQTVWEALAESCGYHQNKIPFRLLAQRIPFRLLAPRKLKSRQALLFGVAGWLPASEWETLPSTSQKEVRALWSEWWKEQGNYGHARLPRSLWSIHGLRPANRPERRLAALSVIAGKIPALVQAIRSGDDSLFSDILRGIKNPFWESHVTWRSGFKRIRLLGEERLREIQINLFWPLVGINAPGAAKSGMGKIRGETNHATRIAHERVLGGIALGPDGRTALVQQGLIQIYREFCQHDATECHDCPFPSMAKNGIRVEENLYNAPS
jgi:hypothetical protein